MNLLLEGSIGAPGLEDDGQAARADFALHEPDIDPVARRRTVGEAGLGE